MDNTLKKIDDILVRKGQPYRTSTLENGYVPIRTLTLSTRSSDYCKSLALVVACNPTSTFIQNCRQLSDEASRKFDRNKTLNISNRKALASWILAQNSAQKRDVHYLMISIANQLL